MSNRDLNPGGKSQVERLQIECFLDAHVPSVQTNRHDSPHAVLGPSTPHTTVSAPPTSQLETNTNPLPLLHLAVMSRVKGPSTMPVHLLVHQAPFSVFCMCIIYVQATGRCSRDPGPQEHCSPDTSLHWNPTPCSSFLWGNSPLWSLGWAIAVSALSPGS